MSRSLFPLTVSVAMLLVLSGFRGCAKSDKNGHDRPPEDDMTWETYETKLRELTGEEDKWKLTIPYLERECEARPDWYATPEGYAEFEISRRFSSLAGLWLEAYPGIRHRLAFTASDIRNLAEFLGTTRNLVYDVEEGDKRIYRLLTEDTGRWAEGWLLLLTGVEFKTKGEVARWLNEHERKLRWDASKGRFVVECEDE